MPVLMCAHELEGESSDKGLVHESEGEGGMKPGVWVGLSHRTQGEGI